MKYNIQHLQMTYRETYLAQQTRGVFAQVGADWSQQQSLFLYELEDEVSVHPLDGQLTVLIFGRLQSQTHSGLKRLQSSPLSLLYQTKVYLIQ